MSLLLPSQRKLCLVILNQKKAKSSQAGAGQHPDAKSESVHVALLYEYEKINEKGTPDPHGFVPLTPQNF